ncbi:MAG TPA: ChaN family lipoprotein [Vicinamibacterales bacterium]|nr:ChaN family lipoprotein [Vicinamibacterales bacterium]
MFGCMLLLLLQTQIVAVTGVQAAPVPAPQAPSVPAPTGQATTPTVAPDAIVLVSYVPERVFDSRKKKFSDFEAMLSELARADVVFVGEQHDDRNTHRLEAALLEGLLRRRGRLTLSLEMFERDAQPALSQYLEGTLGEEEFLKQSRPWPRYASDYRPLLEFAKAHGWPVVAANVPRRLASQVAKEGLATIDKLSPQDRAYVAQSIECPADSYRKRFVETINQHPLPGSDKMSPEERRALDERFYQAQCIKDETMAEAIVAARNEGRDLVVHYNGAFHSDFAEGTASRVRRRLKDARVVVVSMLPVDDLDALKPDKEDRKRADFLVYTLKPRPSPHTTR